MQCSVLPNYGVLVPFPARRPQFQVIDVVLDSGSLFVDKHYQQGNDKGE